MFINKTGVIRKPILNIHAGFVDFPEHFWLMPIVLPAKRFTVDII